VIAVGLVLAIVSAVAINGGYGLQHAAAQKLPPLAVRRPVASLVLLFRARRWLVGFVAGLAGWGAYVVALRFAPLSLVQAAAAGGIGVLALGSGPLRRGELTGIAAALTGLLLLGLSLRAHAPGGGGTVAAVAAWIGVSALAAAVLTRLGRGTGLGAAAGVLYAAGDVATKATVVGGVRLLFVPVLLACHGLAFVCLQLAFQRGRRLATAGLAVLWTNALPILAGTVLFSEGTGGALRIAAFALVLVGAVALSRPPEAPPSRPRSRRLPSPVARPPAQPACALPARPRSRPTSASTARRRPSL
jgi:hypothetical protein